MLETSPSLDFRELLGQNVLSLCHFFLWKANSFQVLDTTQKQIFEPKTVPRDVSFQTEF